LEIPVFVREREQGRFKASSKGARESSEGASTEGALWGSAGAQQMGA